MESREGRGGEMAEEQQRTEERPRRTGAGVERPEVGAPHGEAGAAPGATVPAADVAPEDRPGTPREAEPDADPGAHWATPERQPVGRRHLTRAGLRDLTPVFGTAQPPRGLSGTMRGAAYRIPEHRARHWALLLAADRVDVIENRIGELLGRPLRAAGLPDAAGAVERRPLVGLVGVLAAAWLVRRAVS